MVHPNYFLGARVEQLPRDSNFRKGRSRSFVLTSRQRTIGELHDLRATEWSEDRFP
jgi:hypothetical protein